MATTMSVEVALRKAVENQKDFYQFAECIDTLVKKYIPTKDDREFFLSELAERINDH